MSHSRAGERGWVLASSPIQVCPSGRFWFSTTTNNKKSTATTACDSESVSKAEETVKPLPLHHWAKERVQFAPPGQTTCYKISNDLCLLCIRFTHSIRSTSDPSGCLIMMQKCGYRVTKQNSYISTYKTDGKIAWKLSDQHTYEMRGRSLCYVPVYDWVFSHDFNSPKLLTRVSDLMGTACPIKWTGLKI